MLSTDTCIVLMRGESPTLAVNVQSVALLQKVLIISDLTLFLASG